MRILAFCLTPGCVASLTCDILSNTNYVCTVCVVYVYVHVCVCACVCMSVGIYVCVSSVHVCVYVCTCTSVYIMHKLFLACEKWFA